MLVRHILSLSLSGLVLLGTLGQAAEITLQPRATITGHTVRLGDVARIDDRDPRQATTLAALELGPSPALGGPKIYRLREVQDRVALYGVNLAETRFAGATLVNLETGVAETPLTISSVQRDNAARLIATVVARALEAQHRAAAMYTVEPMLTNELIGKLPTGAHLLRTVSVVEPAIGEQTVTLETLGRQPQRLTVTIRLSAAPTAVVAVRQIARGEVLSAGDLELRPSTTRQPTEALTDLQQAVGREVTRAISAGQILSSDSVKSPTLVQKGDVVDLNILTGGIRIATKARAKTPGGQGELITIEVLSTKQSLLARVSDFQTVEVLGGAAR